MKAKLSPITKAVSTALLSFMAAGAMQAQAFEIGDSQWSGYIRQHIGWNMDNTKDSIGTQDLASKSNGGELNMLRTTLLLQGKGYIGDVAWTLIGRTSQEKHTSFLRDLNNATDNGFPLVGASIDLTDQYEEDNQLREAYIDFETGRISWRLGKQQVIWGETDVFHPNDVIHGFDFTWHSLFEPENEELRKPLWMINATIDMSEELGGALQLIYRPGWDKKNAIGNTYDFQGGRWGQNGARGADFTGLVPIDFDHPDGEYDDANYGFRWEGTIGENDDYSYSFSYYKGLALDPVIVGVMPGEGQSTTVTSNNYTGIAAPIADVFAYQMIETFGASLSGYIEALDAVFRAEISHTPNRWYGDLNTTGATSDLFATNYGIIEEHDVTTLTFGYDTNARLSNILGTSAPSLLSLQVFGTHIHGYDRKTENICKITGVFTPVTGGAGCGNGGDSLVNAFGGIHEKDTWYGTVKFLLPYMNDTLTFDLTALWDFSDGGTMFLPSVEKQIGAHWRLRLEGNFFYGGNKGDAFNNSSQGTSNGMNVIGSFENADQLIARITYQF